MGASLTLRGELGFAQIASISGYGRVEREALDDVDGSPHAIILNGYGNESRFVSQELRLMRELDRWSWIAGAHYYDERHDVGNDFKFFECLRTDACSLLPMTVPGTPAALSGYPPFGHFPATFAPAVELAGTSVATQVIWGYLQRNRSYAGFGEITWQATDRLAMTLGLRYTTERRSIDARSDVRFMDVPDYTGPLRLFPGYDSVEGSKSWDDVSGRLVLDYRLTDDVLLYASAASGFRSGNWTAGRSAARQSSAPPSIRKHCAATS